MAKNFTWQAHGQTDVGRVRATNQDSFSVEERSGLFIVADGMGGHVGGEIASRLCIQGITSFLRSHNKDLKYTDKNTNKILATLSDAINFSSAKIYDRALEDPSLKGMGTTATVVKIIDRHAFVGHVGDSRLYLLRSGFIYQMTLDHSLVSEQVRAGILTKQEAEAHHLRNVITRSVGYQEEEYVDTLSFPLENGDFLILCSDGLYGNMKVTDAQMAEVVGKEGINAVDTLINMANEAGGDDNISVVIVAVSVP